VHNAPEYTWVCLESVLRHTEPPYDLVLVNDGSGAETTAILNQYATRHPHMRVLTNPEAQGYTRAANQGLKASRSEYTVLLNSDTIVSPGWAERLIACAESSPAIGIVGPLSNAATYQSVPEVFDARGHWMQNELHGGATVASFARMVAEVSARIYPRVPVVNGFCFMVRRAVIEKIGYLDEARFPRGYGEENDYCLRAADVGFELAVADDVYVYHATSKSFGNRNRDALTHAAHLAIREKHGEARLAAVDAALRNHIHMDEVRERVRIGYRHAAAALLSPESKTHGARLTDRFLSANRGLSLLFLIPDCAAKAGGTQMVVELAQALQEIGVRVMLAAKTGIRDEYTQFFSAQYSLFTYYSDDAELLELAADFQVAVATIFHSTVQLKQIAERHPRVMPAYFVQDYEPYFYTEARDRKWFDLATQSYALVPGNRLFAISPFVCETVREKHGVAVHKIPGCLDDTLFYPDYTRAPSKAVHVVAMVRPATLWRNPKTTMRVLARLKAELGDAVEISVFGAASEEIKRADLPCDFAHNNYGILMRREVAMLIRNADVFLDLSTFQAFGRTALESMACGVAVVAPCAGGVSDFGVDGKNLLQVDTRDENACFDAAAKLARDAGLRRAIGTQAAADAGLCTVRRTVLALMEWMVTEYARHAGRNPLRAAS
jgi:GT2 family glycosyltransferase